MGLTDAPTLPARHDALHQRVLADPNLLADIDFAIGGPFHLMYPSRVAEHVRSFTAVFDQARVRGVVYYGKKANKAACVVRACADAGAGVDVSSVGEVTSALAGGIRGGDLMVTGPAKSDELLWLATRHGALVALDSVDELARLRRIATADNPAWVLLRVRPPGSTSRFGLTDGELSDAMAQLTQSEWITLEGFSFHLSGYDPAPRATLANALLQRCLAARELGHPASTVSIGGGFGVDYLDADNWSRFTEGVTPTWFHANKKLSDFYPYHCESAGATMLAEILGVGRLADALRSTGVRLAVEPGRALLDQAGCTVLRVQGVKHRRDYDILTVNGTSLSLSEQWFTSEYLPDPVLWPLRPGTPTPTCVGAASCLESDMLSWRRIPLPRPATPGDLLIYPNTAGYQMDSNESEFHNLPLPPKLILHESVDHLRWSHDR